MAVAAPAETKPSLTLQRRFNASPERVWRAWTDGKQMLSWFGPEGAEVVHAETDLRVGGYFHAIFSVPPDPEIHDVSGVYREVKLHRTLVFTWQWISMPERESLVSLFFRPDGDGTHFILTHEQFADEEARDGHEGGWTGCLDRLDAFLRAGG